MTDLQNYKTVAAEALKAAKERYEDEREMLCAWIKSENFKPSRLVFIAHGFTDARNALTTLETATETLNKATARTAPVIYSTISRAFEEFTNAMNNKPKMKLTTTNTEK